MYINVVTFYFIFLIMGASAVIVDDGLHTIGHIVYQVSEQKH